uniref:DUF4222 domain-containing protein n=2 Tax=Serratia marcescens TaxID=615 RepID=A0A9X8YS59_SERMA
MGVIMRTLQEQLQERMRAVLTRNTLAANQGDGLRIPMIGERYRDEHGRMITVTASSSLEVTFKRDDYAGTCTRPLWQFNKFERVGV